MSQIKAGFVELVVETTSVMTDLLADNLQTIHHRCLRACWRFNCPTMMSLFSAEQPITIKDLKAVRYLQDLTHAYRVDCIYLHI